MAFVRFLGFRFFSDLEHSHLNLQGQCQKQPSPNFSFALFNCKEKKLYSVIVSFFRLNYLGRPLLITCQEIYYPGKLCSFVATEESLSKENKVDD